MIIVIINLNCFHLKNVIKSVTQGLFDHNYSPDLLYVWYKLMHSIHYEKQEASLKI